MLNMLTPEERFKDRIEIIGYLTAAAAGIMLIVYFSMIFFYPPVQLHSLETKLGTLLLYSIVLTLGFFIPQYKNRARILYQVYFLALATVAFFQSLERGRWIYGLFLVYSLYALWVLSHPVGLRFFRALRPYEERILKIANWFVFHRVMLTLFMLVSAWKALTRLGLSETGLENDPAQGVLLLFLSGTIFLLLWGLKHLYNWARWIMALLVLSLGISALPDAVGAQNYLYYWKVLAKIFYFLGLSGYLLFSPLIRESFKKSQGLDS
ncbi:hypothetical protein KAR10_03595 [bacterium]|nr:hypothetical protein [bacterium]